MPSAVLADLERAVAKALPSLTLERGALWQEISSLGVGMGELLLAEPDAPELLRELLEFCASERIGVEILGGGTNYVGSDSAAHSLFVRLSKKGFSYCENSGGGRFVVGAASRLSLFVDTVADSGFSGVSGLAGIPGTVGGAIAMNAGAKGMEISNHLAGVSGFDVKTGEALSIEAKNLKTAYRDGGLPAGFFITAATFVFEKDVRSSERTLVDAERARRAATTPKGRSAGCVFRNPSPELPAGFLLDRCGFRGLVEGAAQVSPEHANWIVCGANCPERDFAGLAASIAAKVVERTGISLKPEVRFANMATRDKVVGAARPLKVVVLKGGDSSEREVSLESGAAVAKALREAGHDVVEIDLKKLEIVPEMRRADVVFPVLHGGFGEDGRIQALLEEAKIKFVGCPSSACRIVMDKQASKKVMMEKGISTAPYALLSDANAPLPEGFSYPVIVKPPSEGSTFGISLVEDASAWKPALELALKYSRTVIVEKFVKGVESTVGVLLGKPLPLVEIRYPGKIYDYDAKYTHALGETRYICPPTGIPEDAQRRAQEMALKFFNAVGARDMLRVDVIIGDDGFLCVLEGNSIPGFTASSLLPKAAKASGLSFAELCAELVAAAAGRKA